MPVTSTILRSRVRFTYQRGVPNTTITDIRHDVEPERIDTVFSALALLQNNLAENAYLIQETLLEQA